MAITILLAVMALFLFLYGLNDAKLGFPISACLTFVLSIAGFVLSALHLYGVAQ